jgi:hypothetical protein
MKKLVRCVALLLVVGACVPVFAGNDPLYFHDKAQKQARKLQKQQEKAMRKQMKMQKKFIKQQNRQAQRDAKTWKHSKI